MKKGVRGQMKLSFGMIFSVILIIIFLAFAFYAIYKFLEVKDNMLIGKFGNELQQDVDRIWKGEQGSEDFEYILPKKIDAVCFVDDEFHNLIFKSEDYIEGKKIEHIDIEKILNNKEKFCADNIDGKVLIIIEMDFGEKLVSVRK